APAGTATLDDADCADSPSVDHWNRSVPFALSEKRHDRSSVESSYRAARVSSLAGPDHEVRCAKARTPRSPVMWRAVLSGVEAYEPEAPGSRSLVVAGLAGIVRPPVCTGSDSDSDDSTAE